MLIKISSCFIILVLILLSRILVHYYARHLFIGEKMEDKTLICQDCGQEFLFTVGEQEFYKEKGFNNEPKRCKACRDKRKAAFRAPKTEA